MLPILLVDDDAAVRGLIKIILEGQGFHVIEAEDGLCALSALHNLGGLLCLIVSDVRMPRLDGIGLCKRVKGEFPRIPVLLYSGDAPEALGVGDRFLEKPVHSDKLLSAVRELVVN